MQPLSGTMWKLIGASAFDEEGHELTPPLGELPMGFAMFEAERMIVAVTDGRLSLPPDVPSRAFVAYSGRYMKMCLSQTPTAHRVPIWLGNRSVTSASRAPRAWWQRQRTRCLAEI